MGKDKSEYIKEFKEDFKKEHGVEISDEEVERIVEDLKRLAEIMIPILKRDETRKRKLKKHPKGFDLSDEVGSVYNCKLCYRAVEGKEGWYDKDGLKCLNCQRNLDQKVVTTRICHDEKIWFKDWQLKSDFGVHHATAKKLRKDGVLKAREFRDSRGKVYFRVYLFRENRKFIRSIAKQDQTLSKRRTNPIYADENGPVF